MYRFVLLYTASALFLASVSATNVKKCSNGRPLPISVDVKGCNQPPCNVVKGSKAVMEVNFNGNRDNIQKVTAQVHATVFGIKIPYSLPADVADVCRNLLNSDTCPINSNKNVTYNFVLNVGRSYPRIRVTVEVDLVDERRQSVACFAVDIKVVRS